MNGKIKKSSIYFDTTPTLNSNNAVTSDGIARAIIGGGVTIDSALSTTSENAVQNKVITSEINSLNGNVSTLSTSVNQNSTNIGNLTNLTTTEKTSLVGAINEVASSGIITIDSTLSTTSENAVQNKVITSEINSLNGNVSTLSNSVNQNSTNIGNLTNLATTEKTNLVGAINEVASSGVITIDSALSTTSENAVQNKVITSEINSINGSVSTHSTQLTTLSNGVNQNATNIGNLANLTTTEKTNLVGAINEVASGGNVFNDIGVLRATYTTTSQCAPTTFSYSGTNYSCFDLTDLKNAINDTTGRNINVVGVVVSHTASNYYNRPAFCSPCSDNTSKYIFGGNNQSGIIAPGFQIIWKYTN